MAIADRRQRDRDTRRQLIVSTARALAEREGWDALTTRRLSTEIEYSQPVIYKHFASMEDLVEAIALQGFGELAESLDDARRLAATSDELGAVARAYYAFAVENPALYDAMFSRTTRLRFGGGGSAAPLSATFTAVSAAVATVAGDGDVETLTEVLWAALHGLITLRRNDRVRPEHDTDRLELLIAKFRTPEPATPGGQA